jgi:hypothetical protein
MKIELRGVKYAAFASQETSCFSATVYIDGVKAGTAENSGHGGATMIHPRDLNDRLEAHAKTLPVEKTRYGDMQPSAESIIDDLLMDFLMRRDLTRSMKSKILFLREANIYQSTKLTDAQITGFLRLPREQQLAKFRGAEIILNAIPFDMALAVYRKPEGDHSAIKATPALALAA